MEHEIELLDENVKLPITSLCRQPSSKYDDLILHPPNMIIYDDSIILLLL